MDVYAIGCIMAELFLMHPIFQGISATDQWKKICKVMGTPSEEEWGDAYRLYGRLKKDEKVEMPYYKKKQLTNVIGNASP